MKILELGKFYPPYRGGIETLLQLWCEGFAKRGARVECVVANDRTGGENAELNGVKVHRLASYGRIASTSLCPAYLSATRDHAADLWHMHAPNPLADLACLRGSADTPMVVSYHSDVIRQRTLMSFYRPLLMRMLRRANAVVVATPLHIEHSPWLTQFRSKCEVIPFGIDLAQFRPSPRMRSEVASHWVRHGRPILLTMGRLVEYKGIRHLIDAMARLDAHLWVVGTGPLLETLRAQAGALGVAGRVEFLGNQSDEQRAVLLNACDVFVLPSITPNEAFGLVQVEAMACGKPVVSCDLKSGVPWVNQNEVTGLVVPPADSEALAIALKRLLQDALLRSRLGEAGRARASREFDQLVMIDRYWNLFQRLIGSRMGSNDV